MLIIGVNTRDRELDEGIFDCPNCGQSAEYVRKSRRQYGTLFFIPVLPIGPEHIILECLRCGYQFEADRLAEYKRKPRQNLAESINDLEQSLRSGRPVEYALSDLTAHNIDRDVARRLIHTAIGPARRVCRECHLSYADSVARCVSCDTELPEST